MTILYRTSDGSVAHTRHRFDLIVSFEWSDLFCIEGALYDTNSNDPHLIGYARCSTDKQDLSAQCEV
jgi:hypothetical protein